MNQRIVFTGGPCGGKTTVIKELTENKSWSGYFLSIPEAIHVTGEVGISRDKQLFQLLMVETQKALEECFEQILKTEEKKVILCDRGTLDPLAYWLDQGWSELDFYKHTKSSKEEHYDRYSVVIHLVTTADGAADHYHWDDNELRIEAAEQAIHLDQLLYSIWRDHPHFYYIDNIERDWIRKSRDVHDILKKYCF